MKQSDCRKAILQRWMTLWPGLSGNVPYVFDRDAFDAVTTYARVELDFVDEVQQTYGQPGNRKFLGSGSLSVLLHVVGDSGTANADALAELVRQMFQTVRFGVAGGEEGVTTFATVAHVVPNKSDAQITVMLAETGFEYFDVR